jgi:hypothetical protein
LLWNHGGKQNGALPPFVDLSVTDPAAYVAGFSAGVPLAMAYRGQRGRGGDHGVFCFRLSPVKIHWRFYSCKALYIVFGWLFFTTLFQVSVSGVTAWALTPT